jgi:hypothetical protein
MECVSRHLPLLTELKVDCFSLEDLTVISDAAQRLKVLKCLEIVLPYGNEEPSCDISFIATLSSLQRFTLSFEHGPSVLKLGPIEAPMLGMREFNISSVPHFVYGIGTDSETMWNICHRMPNLEHLTLQSETAQVNLFHL